MIRKYLELQIIQMTEILVLYLLFGTTSCLLGTYSSSENTKQELESPHSVSSAAAITAACATHRALSTV